MTDSKYDPTTQPYDEPQRHVDRTDIVKWPRKVHAEFVESDGGECELMTKVREAADEIERLRLRKRPVAWVQYGGGEPVFRHASPEGDPPEDEGWIALYRRGE